MARAETAAARGGCRGSSDDVGGGCHWRYRPCLGSPPRAPDQRPVEQLPQPHIVPVARQGGALVDGGGTHQRCSRGSEWRQQQQRHGARRWRVTAAHGSHTRRRGGQGRGGRPAGIWGGGAAGLRVSWEGTGVVLSDRGGAHPSRQSRCREGGPGKRRGVGLGVSGGFGGNGQRRSDAAAAAARRHARCHRRRCRGAVAVKRRRWRVVAAATAAAAAAHSTNGAGCDGRPWRPPPSAHAAHPHPPPPCRARGRVAPPSMGVGVRCRGMAAPVQPPAARAGGARRRPAGRRRTGPVPAALGGRGRAGAAAIQTGWAGAVEAKK